MAAVADYSGMIGFNFRGHFYKLEDIMELHIKETDNLRDKVEESERAPRTHGEEPTTRAAEKEILHGDEGVLAHREVRG